MRRRFLEAFLVVVIEESLRAFVPRFLPFAWLLILGLLTLELLTIEAFRERLARSYSRWGTRRRLSSFVLVAIVGAALFVSYWWGISRMIPGVKNPLPEPAAAVDRDDANRRKAFAEFFAAIRNLHDVALRHGTGADLHDAHNEEAAAYDSVSLFLPRADHRWLRSQTNEIERLADDMWRVGGTALQLPVPYAQFTAKVAMLKDELSRKLFPNRLGVADATASAAPTDQQRLDAAITSSKDAPHPKDDGTPPWRGDVIGESGARGAEAPTHPAKTHGAGGEGGRSMSRQIPRHIDEARRTSSLEVLKQFPASKVGIVTLIDRPERATFATELEALFRDAGWTVVRFDVKSFSQDASGVLLIIHDQADMPDMTALRKALEAAHVSHRDVELREIRTPFYTGPLTAVDAVLFVGPAVDPAPLP